MNIGRLKRVLNARGIRSQTELASLIKTSRQYVQETYYKAPYQPFKKSFITLAGVLSTSPESLFRELFSEEEE